MEHFIAPGIALRAACGGYHAPAVADAAVTAAAAFADADANDATTTAAADVAAATTTADSALVADFELCYVAVSRCVDFGSCATDHAVGVGAGSCTAGCTVGLAPCTIGLGSCAACLGLCLCAVGLGSCAVGLGLCGAVSLCAVGCEVALGPYGRTVAIGLECVTAFGTCAVPLGCAIAVGCAITIGVGFAIGLECVTAFGSCAVALGCAIAVG